VRQRNKQIKRMISKQTERQKESTNRQKERTNRKKERTDRQADRQYLAKCHMWKFLKGK
jgi:hypothetical protein